MKWYIKKEFNYFMFGTVHQYGHHFTARKNYATVEIYLN